MGKNDHLLFHRMATVSMIQAPTRARHEPRGAFFQQFDERQTLGEVLAVASQDAHPHIDVRSLVRLGAPTGVRGRFASLLIDQEHVFREIALALVSRDDLEIRRAHGFRTKARPLLRAQAIQCHLASNRWVHCDQNRE